MTIDEFIELLKNGGYLTNREEKQLAEWLELLKWYEQGMEDIPSESGVLPKDVYHAGYNNAIDDFVNIVKEHDFKYGKEDITNCVIGFIEFFAERLKAGVKNE